MNVKTLAQCLPVDLDGASLYRALQTRKTDDGDTLQRLLSGRRGLVVDLCSGVGRTVGFAIDRGWRVVCVDRDREALATVAAQYPVTTVECDLSATCLSLSRDASLVLCAHHSANEVGRLDTIFASASRALRSGGVFYLDVLTTSYPRPNVVEEIRPLGDSTDGRWYLRTCVIPTGGLSHCLVLIATHISGSSGTTRTVTHSLDRLIFLADHVLNVAAEFEFTLTERTEKGQFIFERR